MSEGRPVACSDLLARKWTPQIIAALLSGSRRFSALPAAIPGLGDKVLSRRLAELEEAGIVSRTQYPEIPPRVEYTLTRAGLALESVIREMDGWTAEFAQRIGDNDSGEREPAASCRLSGAVSTPPEASALR